MTQFSHAKRSGMVTLVAATMLWAASAAGAEVNYQLFPGYGGKTGYPPSASYRAWVISFKDNKYYICIASYDLAKPATPTLNCTFGGAFNPPLLNGPDVKTLQAFGGPRGGAGAQEALSNFFWQIDQASGKVQFCIPQVQVNCATTQIP